MSDEIKPGETVTVTVGDKGAGGGGGTSTVSKVEATAGKVGTAVGGFAQKMHEWFSGHPGAAIALAAGIVIGWVIGFLWPR